MQRALTEGLSGQTLAALERLVQAGPETVPSRLAWLRTASRSPAARNLLGLIERLAFVRSLGVSRTLQGAIPQVAFQRLVGEAMRDDGAASGRSDYVTTARAAGHGDASPGGGADRRGVVHVR